MSRSRPGKRESDLQLTLPPDWRRRLADRPAGLLGGRAIAQVRAQTRRELGLPVDRPIIATGHQTLLWHPGILAKYLLVESLTGDRGEIAAANLIVDQHTDRFGDFEVPVRRPDATLGVQRMVLATPRPDVPMGLHSPIEPGDVTTTHPPALPSVASGLKRIVAAVAAHRDRPNAALQMAAALDELMSRWVAPMPGVCASDLAATTLAGALLEEMARDPRRCAESYNAAVQETQGTGIAQLEIAQGRVELPLWIVEPDDRRRRADENDLRQRLAGPGRNQILPRALFLTMLVRLGMCDLFVHGTGGANYDRAMERWLALWLDLEPCPAAVATATLRLPLGDPGDDATVDAASLQAAHRAWHDPESAAGAASPSPTKQAMLESINAAPRRSRQRYEDYKRMHERLTDLRRQHADLIKSAQRQTDKARATAAEASIINRRTWAFPLYPEPMIDSLAEAVREVVSGQWSVVREDK